MGSLVVSVEHVLKNAVVSNNNSNKAGKIEILRELRIIFVVHGS